jgi:CheY-like chemotaxis protein
MTGTQTLIVALVLIAVVFVLLFRALSLRVPAKAKLSLGQFLGAELEFGAADKERAKESVRNATAQRGRGDARTAEERIDQTQTARVARVLWVDDNPDYNLFETVALEELGMFVTKANSTEAGEFYLRRLKFALVITDLRRGNNPDAGMELLETVKKINKDIPVIVYTLNADHQRAQLVDAGAQAVVDTPSELIAAALEYRPR